MLLEGAHINRLSQKRSISPTAARQEEGATKAQETAERVDVSVTSDSKTCS